MTHHGRRIYSEEKEKVVAAIDSVPCWLAILHQDDLKNRMNSSFTSNHPGAINSFLHIILVQNS